MRIFYCRIRMCAQKKNTYMDITIPFTFHKNILFNLHLRHGERLDLYVYRK